MVTKNLIYYIQNPNFSNYEETKEIEKLTQLYPYFQTPQILFAKALLDSNSILYNRQLKKAALYSIDRKNLFNLIAQKIVESEQETSIITKEKNNDLKIGTPLVFKKEEMHSFSEWLNLSKIKKISRSQDDILLDNFVHNTNINIKVNKNEFFKPSKVAKESLIENQDLVTPTLARVYLEQKHYDKAIATYKKLILKYPEKNSLFAEQIELINKIKEK